jgi:GntR family transcriptional regulator/MocR family aminotransferase
MGTALHERRETMQKAIEANALQIAGQGAYGGSSFWMRAPENVDTVQLASNLQKQGVLIEPGESFFGGDDRPKHFYRLAYSSIPVTRISDGIASVANAIRDAQTSGAIRK